MPDSQGNNAGAHEKVRQRSPPRQQRQCAAPSGEQNASDSDPKQTFLRDFPGWTAVDCKGTKGFSIFQNKTLYEEALAREASKLRVMMVGFLLKQNSFLAPRWKPDPGATKEQCAGEDIPLEFPDYCMFASKQQFWCDGLLLECLTKRLRTACVVFAWNKQDKLWQRTVLAHSFQDDFPKQIEDGIPFIAKMMLIDNHFWLLQPVSTLLVLKLGCVRLLKDLVSS